MSSTKSSRIEQGRLEMREAMTRLLLTVYGNIDHSALAAALVPLSPADSDTEMSDAASPSSSGHSGSTSATGAYPTTLTMHTILADGLQYLHLLTYGYVICAGAHKYSQKELVTMLERFLQAQEDGEGVPEAKEGTKEKLQNLSTALKSVTANLKFGITPMEPIARLFEGSYVTSVWSSDSSYESVATRFERQPQRQQQQSYYPACYNRAPASVTSSVEQYVPSVTPSYSNGSMCPSEASCSDSERSRLTQGSISPTQSNCSITPSESQSQGKYLYQEKNHCSWKAHPYRNAPKPGEVVGEANYDIAEVHAHSWRLRHPVPSVAFSPSEYETATDSEYETSSEMRTERSSAPSPESETFAIPTVNSQRGEGVPGAPMGPRSLINYGQGMPKVPTGPKALRQNGRAPSNAPTGHRADRLSRAAAGARRRSASPLRSPVRLALGMGTVPDVTDDDLTEADRIQRALDTIDSMIDGLITEKEAME